MGNPSNKNAPTVLSVVITYNGESWIRKCLSSLQESDYQNDILVIDNNSTDHTVRIIKEEFSNVKLIQSEKNLGFGKANNLGINYGLARSYDYYFLLNQDAWIKKNTITNLIRSFSNKDFGILSPVHLNGTGDKLDYKFFDYLYESRQRTLLADLSLGVRPTIPYPVKFVNAAAWLLSKQCLEKVGGFDPLFEHYGEDDNYIKRLHFKGLKLGVVSDSIIFHDREERAERKQNRTVDQQKALRNLLIKHTDPDHEFSGSVFVREAARLLLISVKFALRLKFGPSITALKILGKFTKYHSAIKDSREKYSDEHPFLANTK